MSPIWGRSESHLQQLRYWLFVTFPQNFKTWAALQTPIQHVKRCTVSYHPGALTLVNTLYKCAECMSSWTGQRSMICSNTTQVDVIWNTSSTWPGSLSRLTRQNTRAETTHSLTKILTRLCSSRSVNTKNNFCTNSTHQSDILLI